MSNELRGYDDFYASMLAQVIAWAGHEDDPDAKEAFAQHLAGNLWAWVQLDRADMLAALTDLVAPRDNGLYCFICIMVWHDGTEQHEWNCPVLVAKAIIDKAEGAHQ